MLLATVPPPAGRTGAPGESTCASCHGGGSRTGSVTFTFAGGNTYTAGTPKTVTVTVTAAGATAFGFEATAKNASNAATGSFTAGSGTTVISGGYIGHSSISSTGTWTFTWNPPAAGTGTVTFYAASIAGTGSTGSDTVFTTSATLTEATGGGGSNTLTVSPNSLTFNSSNGSTPASQSFQVTSSGAPIAFTTGVTTNSGGSWLSATPTGGNTPMGVTVSVNPSGLSAGTYTGTVAVTSASATNSPQNVGVTLNVTGGGGGTPTLSVSPGSLTFNSSNGQAVSPQNVQVSSTVSPVPFNASASTNSGGSWLSVSPASGTTPGSVAVSASVGSLAPGTYTGNVQFTAAGASNSPQNVAVTLVVGSSTPPGSVPALTFSFSVVDRSGGGRQALISGQGSVNSSGQVSGGGSFTFYTSGGEEDRRQTLATGSWKATQAVSFTPAGNSGGVLVLDVTVSPAGSSPVPGTMRIASTGSDSGVTLTLANGTTYSPTGVGRVSIQTGSTSGGSGDGESSGGESSSSSRDR